MSKSLYFPYLLILIAGIIWGASFSLMLIATENAMHPLPLATWQIILAAALYSLICFFSKVPLFNFRHTHYYLVIAVIGVVAPDILYYAAAPHLSAGIFSVTVSTVPVLTYLIMWALRFEPMIAKRALGIAMGMIAILFLVIPDLNLSSESANFWALVVLLCALCYAVENVYLSEAVDEKVDIRELLCGSNLFAIILILPVTLGQGHAIDVTWLMTKEGLAVIGIASTSTIAYMMFFYCVRTSGPVFASQVAYIVTLSGVIWGIVLFSESHTIWVWLSIFTMMIGLFLVNPREKGAS